MLATSRCSGRSDDTERKLPLRRVDDRVDDDGGDVGICTELEGELIKVAARGTSSCPRDSVAVVVVVDGSEDRPSRLSLRSLELAAVEFGFGQGSSDAWPVGPRNLRRICDKDCGFFKNNSIYIFVRTD